jgi:integrase
MAEGAGVWIYERGERFQLRFRAVRGGTVAYETFTRRDAAEARADECRALLAKRVKLTVDDAIEEYREHLERKGRREGTLYVTPLRLRLFFAPNLEDPIGSVSPRLAAKLYRRLVDAKKPDGEPYAVDTHRNALSYARTFGAWCVKQRWWRGNAIDGIEGEGARRKHGKVQLRIDEARAWFNRAMELAPHEQGAVAALSSLLLGMRASEIVTRTVRDLDDDGKLLWVEENQRGRWRPKTDAGRRTLEVPDLLQPLLLGLAKGKAREERLWPEATRYYPRRWVRTICRMARVPLVSAHAMRGLHSTLATDAGATGHLVAGALGHTSFATTAGHYVAPGTVERQRGRKAMRVLSGGRK